MWLKVKGGAVINTNAIACVEECTANTAEVTLVNGRKFTLAYDGTLNPDERVEWEEYLFDMEYRNATMIIGDSIYDDATYHVEGILDALNAGKIINHIDEKLDSIENTIASGFKYIKNEL